MGRVTRLYATASILLSVASAFRSRGLRKKQSPFCSLFAAKQRLTFKNSDDMIDSFEQELVLLAFTSGNCGPCKIQKQELENFALFNRSLKMLRIDMNQFPKLGSKFDIGKLPCTILVKKKEVLLRADGLITAQELWEQLQPLLREGDHQLPPIN